MLPKITRNLLERIIEEIKKDENMDKIKVNVVNPLLQYCYSRLFPYFLIMAIIFLLTFVLALMIFIMLIKQILFDRLTHIKS
jgi:hypothetical protein